MNFTSEEINKKIRLICDNENIGYDVFNDCGKTIPYIGWFWRDVDFDRTKNYYFGILPKYKAESSLDEDNPVERVGFMQNNKWDYEYVIANSDEWKIIKDTIIELISDDVVDINKLIKLNNLIQSLNDGRKKYTEEELWDMYEDI